LATVFNQGDQANGIYIKRTKKAATRRFLFVVFALPKPPYNIGAIKNIL